MLLEVKSSALGEVSDVGDFCRIVIVDDEFIMRQGIKHMLDWEKEGFMIVGEASNGKEGLELIRCTQPHILLCDMVMPVMDGLDLVKIVHTEFADMQVIILSGYDDFKYVKETLINGASDYILKPALSPEDLLKSIQKAAERIPGLQLKKRKASSLESAFERYLLGYDEKLDMTEARGFFTETYCRMLGFSLALRSEQNRDMSGILYEKSEDCLKEMGYCRSLKLLIKEDFMCIVFCYGARDEARVLEDIRKMMAALSVVHRKIFGVLGKQHMDMAELREDYRKDIYPGADQGFYFRGEHLKLAGEDEGPEKNPERFDFNRFASRLNGKQYEEAVFMLYEYIMHALDCRVPEYKLKNLTKNLLYNILSSMSGDREQYDRMRNEFFRRIEEADYAEDFREVFERLTGELKDSRQKEETDSTISRVVEYIEENYGQDLDLAEVAGAFGFNYNYFSAYFNSHIAEGFSEYLNRIRIEKARRLLEEGGCPISQISGMVGYSDHSYFCRVFKRFTGETPSAYRRGRHREAR